MRIGWHALGIGTGARPEVIRAVAAEAAGFAIGWSAEEFTALGVEFSRRGPRTAEYVAAMRTLWADDVASFSGEFVRFEAIRVNPKLVRDRRIPVVIGGNSDAALQRGAAFGDGWYGFYLTVDAALERAATLAGLCRQQGRQHGAGPGELMVAVALTVGQPRGAARTGPSRGYRSRGG